MRIQDLVLVSTNQGKLQEMRKVLKECNINLSSIDEYTQDVAPENAPSFVENSLSKAYFGASKSNLPALADDSGIIVPALNGEPGVLSARYAATQDTGNADPAENRSKLLEKMKGLKGDQRKAYFVCVISLVRHAQDPVPLIFKGEWHGEIATNEIGEQGFGYDSIFFIPDLGKTAAQISMEEKNLISHRGQALAQLVNELMQ